MLAIKILTMKNNNLNFAKIQFHTLKGFVIVFFILQIGVLLNRRW